MEGLQESDYLESHVPILKFFIEKIKPKFCIELGCGYFTTPYLDQAGLSNLAFDSRVAYVNEVEKGLDLVTTDFIQYSRIEEVVNEIKLFNVRYDLGVIGGPVSDRTTFCQKLLDVGCKCTILLDYEQDSMFMYRKIRKPETHDFRVFENTKTGVQTGVFLRNYLDSVKIDNHV